MWRADRASSKGARRTGRGSRTIRARGVRGRFRPNSARRPSEDFISCENWKRKKREHSESAAKASPFRSDARRSGLGSSPGIAFRSVRGSQRSSKPGSSQGTAGNAGAWMDSARASGTPEMRLLGDYRRGSGSHRGHRSQFTQSSVTEGSRLAQQDGPSWGEDVLPLGSEPSGPGEAPGTARRTKDAPRKRREGNISFIDGSKPGSGVFGTPGASAFAYPPYPTPISALTSRR